MQPQKKKRSLSCAFPFYNEREEKTLFRPFHIKHSAHFVFATVFTGLVKSSFSSSPLQRRSRHRRRAYRCPLSWTASHDRAASAPSWGQLPPQTARLRSRAGSDAERPSRRWRRSTPTPFCAALFAATPPTRWKTIPTAPPGTFCATIPSGWSVCAPRSAILAWNPAAPAPGHWQGR